VGTVASRLRGATYGVRPLVALGREQEAAAVLAALRRRREEVEAWLDGPAKKATLTAIDHMIAEQEQNSEAA
jgi:uncharacterized protein YebE (UPF0316 family)